MKCKFFLHVTVNIVLAVTILCVASVGLFGGVTNVFKKDDLAPVYRGNKTDCVCLMVNVYGGTEYLDGFLEIFNKYNVSATFFVGGCWVAKQPEYLKKIADCGHEIGNHGYFHKQHSTLSYAENVEEMVACSKLVFEYCGIYPKLFAPPSGDFSNETLKAAKDNGFKTVMWSRDTIDWRDKDSDLIFTRATKDTTGGEFVLLHPTAHTLAALEKIVKYYLDKNIQPVTVGQMIGEIWNSTNSTPAA